MSVPRSVADVIQKHVTLEVEGIDRMYLNVYQPKLQHDRGVVTFFRYHRQQPVVSSALMEPITTAFIRNIEAFAQANNIPLFPFEKDERKDDVAATFRAQFAANEGVLFIGKAQEKVAVFRTEKRTNPDTGRKYPWIVKSTAMVNQYYIYCVDEDFGPFFLKFSSYFPYNAKLCINGHEYVKRQLAKEGIAFEALDNGVLTCANPKRLQELCDDLSAAKIDKLLRKWLKLFSVSFELTQDGLAEKVGETGEYSWDSRQVLQESKMRSYSFPADVVEAVARDRYCHPDPRVQERMEILWLKTRKKTHDEISELANVSRSTVQRTLRLYSQKGLEGIRTFGWKGQPSALTPYRETLTRLRLRPTRHVDGVARAA